tara:strand:- start:492 stop:1772 length:1281 start_codon:yes stop_codon:yes gene_type:complete
MKDFKTIDIRKQVVFPNLNYRFSRIKENKKEVILDRDFLGENPLHYYIDIKNNELLVANNILDIKNHLEEINRIFNWNRVRAVSNNTKVIINNESFLLALPIEEELGPTLQEYEKPNLDYPNISIIGKRVRDLLETSLEGRLKTIPENKIGILLSGGLDSMSICYLLSNVEDKEITAFTLKVNEDDKDIIKSREIAKRFGINLVEVQIKKEEEGIYVHSNNYTNKLIKLDEVVLNSLKISGNPLKDNALCAVSMYLIGNVIKNEKISTVFCGEGPNEMINDYGFNPLDKGYSTNNKGDISFRQALTFGKKKGDMRLGRGGLAKHALARMGKIFSHYGIRLESPYFDKNIARVMTHIPHLTSYDTIKQHLINAMFVNEKFSDLIEGTSKEKFQDGSGVSKLFRKYNQSKIIEMFENIYGIKKTEYLK